METCENCGRAIGQLETPFIWRESVVCAECHARLSPAGAKITTPFAQMAHVKTNPPALPDYIGSRRACPVCGSTGTPIRKAKGSSGVMILLLLLWIIPGILYAIFMSGYVFVCPKCGAKLGDAV